MTTQPTTVLLTVADLRAVVRFAADNAADVLSWFERVVAGDPRPRAAVEAAYRFADGADRSRLQRVTAVGAHRAASEVPDPISRLAAGAAGDAAAAAYLHPIAQATQVGHILRSAARAVGAAELEAGGDPVAAATALEHALARASTTVVDVLCRYPEAPVGRSRTAQWMRRLDAELRARSAR